MDYSETVFRGRKHSGLVTARQSCAANSKDVSRLEFSVFHKKYEPNPKRAAPEKESQSDKIANNSLQIWSLI